MRIIWTTPKTDLTDLLPLMYREDYVFWAQEEMACAQKKKFLKTSDFKAWKKHIRKSKNDLVIVQEPAMLSKAFAEFFGSDLPFLEGDAALTEGTSHLLWHAKKDAIPVVSAYREGENPAQWLETFAYMLHRKALENEEKGEEILFFLNMISLYLSKKRYKKTLDLYQSLFTKNRRMRKIRILLDDLKEEDALLYQDLKRSYSESAMTNLENQRGSLRAFRSLIKGIRQITDAKDLKEIVEKRRTLLDEEYREALRYLDVKNRSDILDLYSQKKSAIWERRFAEEYAGLPFSDNSKEDGTYDALIRLYRLEDALKEMDEHGKEWEAYGERLQDRIEGLLEKF